MNNIQNMDHCVDISLSHTFGFLFSLFSGEADIGRSNVLLPSEEKKDCIIFKKIVLRNQNLLKTFF
jgi:hypothetical protein